MKRLIVACRKLTESRARKRERYAGLCRMEAAGERGANADELMSLASELGIEPEAVMADVRAHQRAAEIVAGHASRHAAKEKSMQQARHLLNRLNEFARELRTFKTNDREVSDRARLCAEIVEAQCVRSAQRIVAARRVPITTLDRAIGELKQQNPRAFGLDVQAEEASDLVPAGA